MSECYYGWCEHHSKDEPFCRKNECFATNEQLAEFRVKRAAELEKYKKEWEARCGSAGSDISE